MAQAIGNELSKEISKATSKAFGEPFPAHSLRRAYATCLYKLNVPIDTIASLMGHSDTITTREYIDNIMLEQRVVADLSKYVAKLRIDKLPRVEPKVVRRIKRTTIVEESEEVIRGHSRRRRHKRRRSQ